MKDIENILQVSTDAVYTLYSIVYSVLEMGLWSTGYNKSLVLKVRNYFNVYDYDQADCIARVITQKAALNQDQFKSADISCSILITEK